MDSYTSTLESLGRRARQLRILRNLQQRELAARSGVSLGTVQRLERTGSASIEKILRIATALGAEEPFETLFAPPAFKSLDEALSRPPPERKRVRRAK